ncbi:double-strand break repair protein AddB [Yoonia sediminilitoris]|uniref:Double-strand break repair protein AddB n=1 Tax=Yoonia sediminilitoris TaxID=1286148 RepID=A0A2T6KLW2_9RHOB|nr:double-strand break repair protein AddB [Yoonia sediminilitoris]PUB17196.1 double-strand break repair protein AddB [Yoonia sediminilitoris]RCW97491.1 double-strand break repair protein AddB [Yoonia sediminilitoris]
MFDPTGKPRIFGCAPGVDFAQALVNGLLTHGANMSPEDWARTEIYVNTSRMQRRIRDVFDKGPARLLPRVRLVTDLALDPVTIDIPPPVSPLRRRLELSQLVATLLDQQPDLAPRSSLYDLSDSLATLMDEMQGEGVSPDQVAAIDVSNHSGHWARSKNFLDIIAQFFGDTAEAPDKEARQRAVITALAKRWASQPPAHPIIVAGSTGSRGATALFMQAVAKLPQGAIILPGYDFDLPGNVWAAMDDKLTAEDHPQFRFRHLMELIGFDPSDVATWTDDAPAHPARNKLVSLSLRPAPVTDQWLKEGPTLGDLVTATNNLTLLEAPSPRAEAETIALRLRQAVEDGITAALISPDRMLTRQVTAALDRWDIKPDDSAGTPLQLSPPGRMLRHVAALMETVLTSETLLTILKHPLCHSEREDRGDHLRHTRELELHLRRHGPPFPTRDALEGWAKTDPTRQAWAKWVTDTFIVPIASEPRLLAHHLQDHISRAEKICGGPDTEESGGLWREKAGREALRICNMLEQDADAGGILGNRDYSALFGAVLSQGVVRDRDEGHPNILIWGTLEARVHGVDLTILGGMNDGVWPEAPPPDPWLNRKMRAEAGLLLPERRIGLSAHDYQQAVAGKDVWITRSKRSADAETIPSRWVNRLTNLLNGLPDQNGQLALGQMRARADHWAAMAAKLSSPVHQTPPAKRPSPCPPITSRPQKLSVTRIKTLIRDPFAIYARNVLRLNPLDPLSPSADAPLRGIIVHKILERFIKEQRDPTDPAALMQIAQEEFDAQCPWPTIRAQWIARMERSVDKFLADEQDRQAQAVTCNTESWGEIGVNQTGVTLTCKADRIDLSAEGEALIYDYKTGTVPSAPQQEKFDKQLLLEAAMVTFGAFKTIGPKPVKSATFIGVNTTMKNSAAPLKKQPVDQVWAELDTLFANWQRLDRGYTARLALFLKNDISPYDHLSRFGEWDTSDDPAPVVLT